MSIAHLVRLQLKLGISVAQTRDEYSSLGKSAPHIRWNECSSKGKSMNKLDIGIVKKECT